MSVSGSGFFLARGGGFGRSFLGGGLGGSLPGVLQVQRVFPPTPSGLRTYTALVLGCVWSKAVAHPLVPTVCGPACRCGGHPGCQRVWCAGIRRYSRGSHFTVSRLTPPASAVGRGTDWQLEVGYTASNPWSAPWGRLTPSAAAVGRGIGRQAVA